MATNTAADESQLTNEELLEEIIVGDQSVIHKGLDIGGIPFTNANHERRALTVLHLPTGKHYTKVIGAGDYKFSQQSMSKPSAAMYAMAHEGPDLVLHKFKEQIGNDFSGKKYNQVNLDPSTGNPYNYSDNIGALKVWKLIYNATPDVDPFPGFLAWFRRMVGRRVDVDMDMANGEYAMGGSNMLLLDKLHLTDSARHHVYHSYCRACAIRVTTLDAAQVFAVIANHGQSAIGAGHIVHPHVAHYIHRGMANHGAYDQSRDLFNKYRLHSKTGVEGGIMGSLEDLDWVFAGHHSGLNRYGNSGEVIKWVRGLREARVGFSNAGVLSGTISDHRVRGEALHLSLYRVMKPETLAAIEAALENSELPDNMFRNKHTGKLEFYLKRNHNQRELAESQLLASGTDMHGQFKKYYLMPTVAHWIAKVAVVDAEEGLWRPQSAK